MPNTILGYRYSVINYLKHEHKKLLIWVDLLLPKCHNNRDGLLVTVFRSHTSINGSAFTYLVQIALCAHLYIIRLTLRPKTFGWSELDISGLYFNRSGQLYGSGFFGPQVCESYRTRYLRGDSNFIPDHLVELHCLEIKIVGCLTQLSLFVILYLCIYNRGFPFLKQLKKVLLMGTGVFSQTTIHNID